MIRKLFGTRATASGRNNYGGFGRLRRRARLVLATSALGGALIACNARKVQEPYCEIAGSANDTFEQNVINKLDLLFLIDNSSSTKDKQVNINCNFPRFIDVLSKLPAGLPDLHMAVVSSDMGSGSVAIPSCGRMGGDDGAMQGTPHPQVTDCSMNGGTTLDTTGCNGPMDGKGWIRYKSATDNNIGGEPLSKAFACIAALGETGCGYESQLNAIKRALKRATDTNDAINGGFLRNDAFLGIIIVTDEDDCSMTETSLIGDTGGGTDIMSELGPLTSFRCTELGVTCDGDGPNSATSWVRDPNNHALLRQAGPTGLQSYKNCHANDMGVGIPNERHRLLSVAELITQIQALKPPGSTIVEAIGAQPPPDGVFKVEIGMSAGNPVPELGASCMGGAGVGKGIPAVRIQQFLQGWEAQKKVVSVCQNSFADALATMAMKIGQRLGDQCISQRPLDTAGRPTSDPAVADCKVSDVIDPGTKECPIKIERCGGDKMTEIPPCAAMVIPDAAAYRQTCWYLQKDPKKMDGSAACPATGLALQVCRSGYNAATSACNAMPADPPPNTQLRVKCASCTPSNHGVECKGDGLDNDCDGVIDDQGEPCKCT